MNWLTNTRRLLMAILGGYVVICLAWSLATPPYEASDETTHIAFVEQVARGSIPVLPSPIQEAAQPPGYYLLEAALVRILHLPPPPRLIPIINDPNPIRPLFGHAGERRFLGGALTVRIMRLLTTAFGLLALILVYRILARLLEPRWALAGLALVAFIPQYTFFSSVVDNDAMSYAVGAAICLCGVALVGAENRRRRLLLAAAMGASLGLMFWAKEYAFALIPLPAIALVLARAGWRDTIVGSTAAWVVAVVVASPIFLRNLLLYHTPWPFALERSNLERIIPALVVPRSPLDPWLWTALPSGLFQSVWFSGGWGQVVWPAVVYWALAIVVLPLAVIGVASVRSRAALVPVVALVLMYVGTFWAALTLSAYPGRYMFPALSAIALLLTLGLQRLTPAKFSRFVQIGAPLVVVALNLYALSLMVQVLDQHVFHL